MLTREIVFHPPEGAVLKLARLLGQSVRLVRALALVLVNTVSVPELVALLQAPETSTE